MKKIMICAFILSIAICILSSCSNEKDIIGKWYNDEGDCLVIQSDNTYYIDFATNKFGYDIGMDKGTWTYLEEENFFKFHAKNYDRDVMKVQIEKDEKGAYIKYSYFGTFYKN